MTTALLVALGAALGAPSRYLVDLAVRSRFGSRVPWGTFVVNVAGCAVLGGISAAVAHGAPDWLLGLVGTGFCGALTTFSTFGFETVRLAQERAPLTAAGYALGSLGAGLGACSLAWWLVAAL